MIDFGELLRVAHLLIPVCSLTRAYCPLPSEGVGPWWGGASLPPEQEEGSSDVYIFLIQPNVSAILPVWMPVSVS